MRCFSEIRRTMIARAFLCGMSIEDLAILLNVKPTVIEQIIRVIARKAS